MNPDKWTRLLTYLLTWVGFLVWASDRKWDDPNRSPESRQRLRLCRTVWAFGLIALGLPVVSMLRQPEPIPKFGFLINGVAVPAGGYVTVPRRNGVSQLQVDLFNEGPVPAEGIVMFAHFQTNVFVTKFDGWRRVSRFIPRGPTLDPLVGAQLFSIGYDRQTLGVSNGFHCDPLTVQATNYIVIAVKFEVTERRKTWPEVLFWLHLNDHTNRSYLGY